MKTNNYQNKIELTAYTARELMPRLPYHNLRHALNVCRIADRFAALENVDYERKFLLKTAALLHDIIYHVGRKDNEERSAEFARGYLPKIGYSVKQADKVAELILATKMPQMPKNLLEKIICDADLNVLGGDDFLNWNERLRNEWGIKKGEGWYAAQVEFLQNHHYHTGGARKMRDEGKKRNIEIFKRMLGGKLKC